MAFFIVLGVLALLGVIGTIVALRSDGYGPVRTDWTRLPDRPSTPATPDAAQAAAAAPAQNTDTARAQNAGAAALAPNTASPLPHEPRTGWNLLPATRRAR
ncbi:hypothetical protein [Microbacterium sp. 18062]|uniref:hypothetical protein n=1 Tax=Microbacterium sp. 18062 TaxID=2681410 RepID=UPI0013573A99|nr:hypothetical protein [Microbacterium sp. 18062]